MAMSSAACAVVAMGPRRNGRVAMETTVKHPPIRLAIMSLRCCWTTFDGRSWECSRADSDYLERLSLRRVKLDIHL